MNLRFFAVVLWAVWFTAVGVSQAQVTQTDGREVQKILLNGKEYYLHIIQKGEGLYRISLNYGVSVQEILDANDDISESLKVGQILRIPVISGRNTTEGELGRSREFLYHTVERGQTAYFISRKYNIALDDLYQSNPGTENGLVVGAILRIPVAGSAPSSAAAAAGRPAAASGAASILQEDGYDYHVVKPGETIYGLSRNFQITQEELVEANPALRSGELRVGTEVRIPRAAVAAEEEVQARDTVKQGVAPGFIESGKYLYHTIVPGQTFYSIGRLYQVELEDLRAANPGVTQDDLKVGYMLRVPRPQMDEEEALAEVDEDKLFRSHRVRRRETLYGISREYHIDMEVLRRVNPEVDFQNLSNGTRLRIPTDEWFARETARAMEAQRPAVPPARGRVDERFKPVADCSRNRTLGYSEPIKVALLLPFDANAAQVVAAGRDSLQQVREARLAANRARLFNEFYSGVLLALDTLKQRGISVDLSVYDIAPDSLALQRALRDPSLKEAHLMIGPALAGQLPMVSAFSREHQIPLVFPLSNTNTELEYNPWLFHVNSPDALVLDRIAKSVVRQASGGRLLVVLPEEEEPQADELVALIKEEARTANLRYMEYKSSANDLMELQSLLTGEGDFYVVVPSVKTSALSRLVPILYGVREKTKARINFIGLSDVLFQTVDPEQVHALNGTFYRSFGLDYSTPHTKAFIDKYRRWYHTEPHAISPFFQSSDANASYSRYGIWGYDVAHYFVGAIAAFGRDFDLCMDQLEPDQVQFRFEFERVSNWGGFYNAGLYMFRFRPDLRMERLPVLP
ncbi:MAG TPA: LysM peptidoglycan-binding domain-containing protein [Bacteroidales bacterium]|nr:LysM peptidoglycan-binding domain-containing protein [Bacteroidales bacterium]